MNINSTFQFEKVGKIQNLGNVVYMMMFMHLSMLIPGGKGAGNGWGFDCEFYPHRQAFENDFFPGYGRFVMQFQYEAWSLESRKPEVQKLLLFISASASVFSGLLEFEYSTQSGFWG
jgi:hypothetical protein